MDEVEGEIIKKIQVLKSSKEDKSDEIKTLEWVKDLLDFYKKEAER